MFDRQLCDAFFALEEEGSREEGSARVLCESHTSIINIKDLGTCYLCEMGESLANKARRSRKMIRSNQNLFRHSLDSSQNVVHLVPIQSHGYMSQPQK